MSWWLAKEAMDCVWGHWWGFSAKEGRVQTWEMVLPSSTHCCVADMATCSGSLQSLAGETLLPFYWRVVYCVFFTVVVFYTLMVLWQVLLLKKRWCCFSSSCPFWQVIWLNTIFQKFCVFLIQLEGISACCGRVQAGGKNSWSPDSVPASWLKYECFP